MNEIPQHQQSRPRLMVRIIFCTGTACLFLMTMFSNCGVFILPVTAPTAVLKREVEKNNEHRKGPIPESEWNRNQLWVRVSSQPAVFLPKGYGRHLPRTQNDGTWVIDERDGKRLFVPKDGVDGISYRVLLADAKSATTWQPRPSLKITPESLISGQVEEQ